MDLFLRIIDKYTYSNVRKANCLSPNFITMYSSLKTHAVLIKELYPKESVSLSNANLFKRDAFEEPNCTKLRWCCGKINKSTH